MERGAPATTFDLRTKIFAAVGADVPDRWRPAAISRTVAPRVPLLLMMPLRSLGGVFGLLLAVAACSESSPPGPRGNGAGGSTGGTPSGGANAVQAGSGGRAGSAAGGPVAGGASGGAINSAGSGGSSHGGDGQAGAGAGAGAGAPSGFPFDAVPVVLTNDAGYCWFEDPRALFVGQSLVVGSVASGWEDASKRGDIESIVYDFDSGETSVSELHDRFELDDHDSPAYVLRPDGKLLAMYAKHGSENHSYYRVSSAGSLTMWDAERTFTPTSSTRLTYSNLFLLTSESNRIYDFYRGLDDSYKPSFAYSDDGGDTWLSGNIVINVPSTQKHRPYVRYASNGNDTIHLLYTEAHPRDYDNSLYHVFYRGGSLHESSGAELHPLSEGLTQPTEGTRIFQGDADNVAWGMDLELDADGHPVAAYSVQVGSAGLPTGQGGEDIRYRYARWDGTSWKDFPLAYGGSRLYSGEDDYSGLASIDPADANVVYLSTNADPVSGEPLISTSDNERHYELFRATTTDGGQSWQFAPITSNSTVDNLRPLVPPPGADGRRALIWLRGVYRSYTSYQQELVMVSWK
jgi:hypothetical protein